MPLKNPTVYSLIVKYKMHIISPDNNEEYEEDDPETWKVISYKHGGYWWAGNTLKDAVYQCAKTCGEKLT
jgi:acetyl esterase/lipase